MESGESARDNLGERESAHIYKDRHRKGLKKEKGKKVMAQKRTIILGRIRKGKGKRGGEGERER